MKREKDLCKCGEMKLKSSRKCRKCYGKNKLRGVSRLLSLKEKKT